MLKAAIATRATAEKAIEAARWTESWLLCDRHRADGSGTGSQISAARALRSRDRQKGARTRS
jgi:hypothetical protein